MKYIYFDYNASTPIDPEVADVMKPLLSGFFGNPSSDHHFGIEARKVIQQARVQVASLLNCDASEIVFTSGGTESNNAAIKGAAFGLRNKGNHIITSAVEHPAVLEVCQWLENQGFAVTYLPVDEFGAVSPIDLQEAINESTILISIMHANNETGTIQPVEEIGAIAKEENILFHIDAAQSAGKIPVDTAEIPAGMISLAGHKMYAPKGVGVLFVREGVNPEKIMHGANHEMNRRAGTENVLEIAGLGKAAEIVRRDLDKNMKKFRLLSGQLYNELKYHISGISLNGHQEKRLPNTVNISFPGIQAQTLLSELDVIAASAGAACHAGTDTLSHVLKAMKLSRERILGAVRFSVGRNTTNEEVSEAVKLISQAWQRLSGENTKHAFTSDIRLTGFSAGLGCACKTSPEILEKILSGSIGASDPSVLVGPESMDDASVVKINNDIVLINSLDFITPVVDDPYAYGAIAAANALSDIYAMGGRPVSALSICALPVNRLPVETFREILKGASDKVAEAGISVSGGHTVDDNELKFGLSVSGLAHPGKIVRNSGAKAGDLLVLTKSLGTGIISTGVKRKMTSEDMIREATASMMQLNRIAGETMLRYPVSACTDITGFGLIGHLLEMLAYEKIGAEISTSSVPFLKGARELIVSNIIPGGTLRNLEHYSQSIMWDDKISQVDKLLLCDAQTSGGLLISIPDKDAEPFLSELRKNEINAHIIGKINTDPAIKIKINP